MCTAFFITAGMAAVFAQSAPAMSALTVPVGSLPEGCRLTPPPPAPTPIPLPRPHFPDNPWVGTDYSYIANVRTALEHLPPVKLPDGPPLDPTTASKLAWTLKGDIAEAYRASYETTLGGSILVQAVRYKDAKWATLDPRKPDRIVRDSTVILVTGNPQGECFNAVRSYIQSLK